MTLAPGGASSDDAAPYDLRGLKCPLPVLKIRKRMQAMAVGEMLSVLTDDPMAAIDVPHFCNEAGHRLIETTAFENGHRFLVEKAR